MAAVESTKENTRMVLNIFALREPCLFVLVFLFSKEPDGMIITLLFRDQSEMQQSLFDSVIINGSSYVVSFLL